MLSFSEKFRLIPPIKHIHFGFCFSTSKIPGNVTIVAQKLEIVSFSRHGKPLKRNKSSSRIKVSLHKGLWDQFTWITLMFCSSFTDFINASNISLLNPVVNLKYCNCFNWCIFGIITCIFVFSSSINSSLSSWCKVRITDRHMSGLVELRIDNGRI